ncbi:MAG: hypothetical protein IT183_13680, partial [Acidobacteria bacterium]|nr:hypothetical protein [Acidobacteriota bacterium]
PMDRPYAGAIGINLNSTSGPAYGGFIPTHLPGCVLWLRADLGITKDGSDNVSNWADQSGNGNDAVQGTGANQPLWEASVVGGRPGVTGNGTTDVMTITSIDLSATTGATLLLVVKDSATTGTYFEQTNGGSVDPGVGIRVYDIDDWEAWTKGSATAYKRALTVLGAGRSAGRVLSLRVDQTAAAASEMQARQSGGSAVGLSWLAGETQESTANLGNSTYSIFARAASSWVAGSLCEAILYSSALSVADHQRVHQYLGARYGLSLTAVS